MKPLPLMREKVRAIIASHYSRNTITDGQMNDELANLARRKKAETLDDFDRTLYFRLEQAGFDWPAKIRYV